MEHYQQVEVHCGPLVATLRYMPATGRVMARAKLGLVASVELSKADGSGIDALDAKVSICAKFQGKQLFTPIVITKKISERAHQWDLRSKSHVNPDALGALPEQREGTLVVTVESLGKSVSEEFPLKILANTEFLLLPELWGMLASYVQTQDPALKRLREQVQELLDTQPASSGRQELKNLAEACYQVLGQFEFQPDHSANSTAATNISITAGEESWQVPVVRLRTSGEVLRQGTATASELVLLYSAIAAACRLEPVLVIARGRLLAAVNLERPLNSAVVQGKMKPQNYLRGKKLLTFDPVQALNRVPFEKAVAEAEKYFELAQGLVDVCSHLKNHVAELPINESIEGFDAEEIMASNCALANSDGAAEVVPDATVLADNSSGKQGKVAENIEALEQIEAPGQDLKVDNSAEPPHRVQDWQRRLLDLKLTNPLLSLKTKAYKLELRQGMLAELEQLILAGHSLSLKDMKAIDPFDRGKGIDDATQLSDQALRNKLLDQHKVHIDTNRSTYTNGLNELKKKSLMLAEETGNANLYLSLGELTYAKAGRTNKAPLFLVPVKLERSSKMAPFKIKCDGEGEIIPNYCLSEWLKKEYGLTLVTLNELPEDNLELDILQMFTAISRELVEANSEMKVSQTAYLFIANFSTFNMWKDMGECWEKFMASPVFTHIATSSGRAFLDPNGDSDISTLKTDETKNILPIAADGSQLQAVVAATSGRSFVLQGPPGTGKSQTITNLIAANLVAGKKVLFVAEKQAALDVVKVRLEDIGLSKFVLDMHGTDNVNKAVRNQIKAAIDAKYSYEPERWQLRKSRLVEDINALQKYSDAIHTPNKLNKSLWGALTLSEDIKRNDDAKLICLPSGYAQNPNPSPDELEGLVKDVAKNWVDPELLARWEGFDLSGSLNSLKEAALNLSAACAELAETSAFDQLIAGELSASKTGEDLDSFLAVNQKQLLSRPQREEVEDTLALIKTVVSQARSLKDLLEALLATYSQAFIEIGDLDQLEQAATQARSWKLGRRARRRHFASILAGALQAELAVTAQKKLVKTYRPKKVMESVGQMRALRVQMSHILDQLDQLPELKKRLMLWDNDFVQRLEDFQASLELQEKLPIWLWDAGELAELRQALRQLESSERTWRELTQAPECNLGGQELKTHIDQWIQRGQQVEQDLPKLRQVARLNKAIQALESKGLDELAGYLKHQKLTPAQVEASLELALCAQSIEERLAAFELDNFDDVEQQELTQNTNKNWQQVRDMYRQVLPAKLFEARGWTNQPDQDTQQLRMQLDAKRNSASIRTLFSKYGQQILSATPCVMASPASLATHIEPGALMFDLVVFDEASQVTVPQAMGAIGRAKAAVIVGDNKQMPPTNFFAANQDDDMAEDSETINDLESILDEAMEVRLPSLMLTWHYRSQTESLIAFSNQHYYSNELATLPAAGQMPGTGIFWRRVDGHFMRKADPHYQANKLNTNEVEAKAIIEEISRRLNDPLTKDQSLGVVTMNAKQMDLITTLLEESDDPLIAEHMPGEGVAPDKTIFVKNLENVQGDERDVILMSVGFSKDPLKNRLPLNFGPLNRQGGQRRLNVAVTRARTAVVVFASFDPEDMQLTKNSAQGLQDLRDYLLLARDGVKTDTSTRGDRQEILLRDLLAKALRERGWQVQNDYGLSAYKVDIALRKPGQENWQFALIMDSKRWANLATVTDRELTPLFLEQKLGWIKTIRVYTPLLTEGIEQYADALTSHLEEKLKGECLWD
ncbi:hypothetical protein HMPREF0045_00364 [Actinomyces graevenitzii C83]|uniref:DNA2/NAM7 helicase-like C-terminal domain-containing protein n=1 Tax=Actinomyces graevenitzii C83 TaxID=435830 RepID=G9PD85_9ACTO|nr:hypothetical protein HMPREF0045_00364 [Actinomyces graevenitzii C83]